MISETDLVTCHPLKSVCVLLSAVGHHLNKKEFTLSTIDEELLPGKTRIVYKSSASDKTREDALPIVAYSVAGVSLRPYYAAYPVAGMENATAAEMVGEITFSISTTNEALTAELGLEIAGFCMSIHKALQEYDMFISEASVGEVSRGKAGYFDTAVRVSASLGKPTWNHETNSGILREIGLRLSFK